MELLNGLKSLNLAMGFALELCMLAAFGAWGFYGERTLLLKWVLGFGLPVVAAVIWSVVSAP